MLQAKMKNWYNSIDMHYSYTKLNSCMQLWTKPLCFSGEPLLQLSFETLPLPDRKNKKQYVSICLSSLISKTKAVYSSQSISKKQTESHHWWSILLSPQNNNSSNLDHNYRFQQSLILLIEWLHRYLAQAKTCLPIL